MANEPIEIKIDNKTVNEKLLELAKRGENLRPLMKNIAGILHPLQRKTLKKRADLTNGLNFLRLQKKSEKRKINGPDRFCKLKVSLYPL